MLLAHILMFENQTPPFLTVEKKKKKAGLFSALLLKYAVVCACPFI